MEPNEAAILLTSRAREKESDPFALRDLTSELVSTAGRMEPAKAARMLVSALARSERDVFGADDVRARLVLGLSSVAGRMEPAAAADLCRPFARMLAKELGTELENNKDSPLENRDKGGGTWEVNMVAQKLELLGPGLAALASRLKPAESAKLCGSVARALSTTIERNRGHGPLKRLRDAPETNGTYGGEKVVFADRTDVGSGSGGRKGSKERVGASMDRGLAGAG